MSRVAVRNSQESTQRRKRGEAAWQGGLSRRGEKRSPRIVPLRIQALASGSDREADAKVDPGCGGFHLGTPSFGGGGGGDLGIRHGLPSVEGG